MLESIGFVENKSFPCLLPNWNGEENVLIEIYAADSLAIGKEKRIKW
jgi:hypothetical protein